MSKVEEVNKQLHEIFSSENLKKDNFFRELVEKDSEGCKQKRSSKTRKKLLICLYRGSYQKNEYDQAIQTDP